MLYFAMTPLAVMSVGPPAANGTTIRIVDLGWERPEEEAAWSHLTRV